MMKKYTCWLLLLLFCLNLAGCRSAKKSLKRGDFDDSVLRACEKLRDTPTHVSSADILKVAYPAALEQHLAEINESKRSEDLFHYEKELDALVRLNRLYNAIASCDACQKAIKPRNLQKEEQWAREEAAKIRFNEGSRFLQSGGRENARTAFVHFERTVEIDPAYPELREKRDLAYNIACFHVVVEQVLVTSKSYQLSNAYFQDRINDFLKTNKKLNRFVRFYTPQEATDVRLSPDHIITLQFDDFVVGQTLIERNTETVTSKDSVKVGEKTMRREKIPIYERVTAKLTRSRKTLVSGGLLDMQISEFRSQKSVYTEKFPGEYNWTCEWATFAGDERALTSAELRLCKTKELMPPEPQVLFEEFSNPIFENLTSRLRNFYAKY